MHGLACRIKVLPLWGSAIAEILIRRAVLAILDRYQSDLAGAPLRVCALISF